MPLPDERARDAQARPPRAAMPPNCPHVLLVAHGFPPANSSAALRALSLTERLAGDGWRTTVISVPAARHASHDLTLADRVPPACTVQRAFSFDSKAAFAVRGRYPRLLAFPDRAVSWMLPALRHALRAHRRHPIDTVVSTSPPVTAHCVAALVQRATGAAWVAELRDPWNLDATGGVLTRAADRVLEERVYARADRIVVTTDALARDLRRRAGGRWAAKVRVVPNGFDEPDFVGRRAPAPPRPFTIVHAGTCVPPYRNPLGFLTAVRGGLDRGALRDVDIRFVGAGDALQRALGPWLVTAGLADRVHIVPRVPHHAAIAAMHDAALLLLLQDRDSHRASIPQKAYEYLRSGRPMLAIAPATSATAALVGGYDGVFLAEPSDGTAVARALAAAFAMWRADPSRTFDRDVRRYRRSELAAAMQRVITEAQHGAARP